MLSAKVKFGVLVLLALGTVSSSLGLLAHRGNAAQPPHKVAPEPALPPPLEEGQDRKPVRTALEKKAEIKPRPARSPEERATLLKAQVVMAASAYRGKLEELSRTRRFGNVLVLVNENPETIYRWSVRWLKAERALKPKHEAQVAALEAHFQRMAKLQAVIKEMTKDLLPRYRADQTEWYLLEAELWLGEAKAAKK